MHCGSERGIFKAGSSVSQVLKPKEQSQRQGLPGLPHPPASGPSIPKGACPGSSLSDCYGLNINVPKAQVKVWSQRVAPLGEAGSKGGSCVAGGLPLLSLLEALPCQQLPPQSTLQTRCSAPKQEGQATADWNFSNKKPESNLFHCWWEQGTETHQAVQRERSRRKVTSFFPG